MESLDLEADRRTFPVSPKESSSPAAPGVLLSPKAAALLRRVACGVISVGGTPALVATRYFYSWGDIRLRRIGDAQPVRDRIGRDLSLPSLLRRNYPCSPLRLRHAGGRERTIYNTVADIPSIDQCLH